MKTRDKGRLLCHPENVYALHCGMSSLMGGGFIFNTIHNVAANVPPENLIAMYETVIGEKLR